MTMNVPIKVKDQNMDFRLKLFDMFMKGRYTDVSLVCDEGTEVWAHKFVLATASSVLRGMFREDANKPTERQVIRIAGANYQDLIALIQWVYLGFFKVTEVNGNMVGIAEGLKINLGLKIHEENAEYENNVYEEDVDDVTIPEEEDERQEEPLNVNSNLILQKPPVTVHNIPAPLLVNDDGTVTPVEEILAKPENIEPELMHADANKEPVSVRVHMPNLSNNG